MELAERIVDAGLDHAERNGFLVTVAILDGHGHIVALSRMDKAKFLSVEIARGKALASVHFRRSTADVERMAGPKPSFFTSVSFMNAGSMAVSRGGLPIWIDGEVAGGIGVSGTFAEHDEAVAEAALRAVGLPISCPPDGELAQEGISFRKPRP